ncbi:hypothetical protein GJV85_09500 [Sulfurimonas aquatica]|uniref:Uncharacterized protein n=1 Tax=Sulfurimonas aquatica TaxID=2672570 RepID=A0A975B158_9BACT|nr:hypothetical protein [Sulfurimonas aquatica]QSZ42332.1 hypothetical protein GJV85_09500 [Sulfurimonas aquatica]
MNWLDFFQEKQPCPFKFGRDINANIAKDEEELYNKAYEAFDAKEILDAYEYFLRSLINYSDTISNENIILDKNETELKFEMIQGSAKINGLVTKEHLYAEVSIVKSKDASVALKRYILERNYQLTYVNYFSDGQYIKLKLYLDNITLSPQKVFFPLRELALNADFDKEYILSEFTDVILEDSAHIQNLKEDEIQVKYKHLKKWIEELNAKVLTLPSNDNAGMQSFLYLNILFKIDYLLMPRRKMYHKLSKKIQLYFSDEHTTMESKNDELNKYVLKLHEMSYEDFATNFYSSKQTFNQTEKSSYEDVVNFINESLIKVRWYKNNRYAQIIPTIYKYIAFNCLYNYGLNPVVKQLFHTLVEIQNSEFFRDLGCDALYDIGKQEFSKKAIISKIEKIHNENKHKFKALKIQTDELNFNSMNEFSNSFYIMLKTLDFEEISI